MFFLISSVQNAYRDTYRIVTPVSRYVSYREVTVSFHPYFWINNSRGEHTSS